MLLKSLLLSIVVISLGFRIHGLETKIFCHNMQGFEDAAQYITNMAKKRYAYVPICYDEHWSLVIICHPGHPKRNDHGRPGLLHLDSLSKIHQSDEIFGHIEEFMRKTSWQGLGESVCIQKRRVSISKQENSFDCGIFVLWSMRKFLQICPWSFTSAAYSKHAEMVSTHNLSNYVCEADFRKLVTFLSTLKD